MPLSNIATNAEYWAFLRYVSPQFAGITPEGTANLFTERGWSALTQNGFSAINEFWGIFIPWYLAQVDVALSQDPLEEAGFGQTYGDLPGGAIQKIGMNSVAAVTPAYRNLQNGRGPDPFVVRKPTANARYFKYNYDYQSLITVPDEWETKQLFLRDYGFSEFMAGVMQGLQNGYIESRATARLEVFNAAINNEEYPLQTTQKIQIQEPDHTNPETLVDFVRATKKVAAAMRMVIASGKFNAEKHRTLPAKDGLFLLVRAGYMTDLDLDVVRGSFNAETLNLPVKVVEVPHFGGLVPYADAGYTQRLYPAYSEDLGEQIGFNTAEGQTVATHTEDQVFWKDPNEGVYAIMASPRVMMVANHNPYQVEPIRNPRGRYTNFWASAPDNGIWYDPNYTFVVFASADIATLSANDLTRAVAIGGKTAVKK